jgi:hypothetical protein
MYLAKIIVYFSILIWLLPPFRQIKGGYFLYFLILGYSDPLSLFLGWMFKVDNGYTQLITAFLLTISILFYNNNLNLKWIAALLLLLMLSFWKVGVENRYFYFIIFHIIILIQILIPSVKEFYQGHRINIYFSVLLVYELTTILKFVAVIYNYYSGVYLFYLSAVFGMFIALFFIFYNLQNSPLIKLSDRLTEDK